MASVLSGTGNRLLVLVRDLAPACPKCGTERTEAPACARCGLNAARMDAYRSNRDASVPPRLAAAWDDAVAHWHEPAAHDRVVAINAELESFAWIATRYRELARTGDAIAQAQLARVSRASQDQRSKIKGPRSKVQDQKSKIQNPKSKIQNPRDSLLFMISSLTIRMLGVFD